MLANDLLSTAIELIACFTYHASAQAGVAQLVEQRIRNAKVGGSTPLSGTTTIQNLVNQNPSWRFMTLTYRSDRYILFDSQM